jgi:hypothetical protein
MGLVLTLRLYLQHNSIECQYAAWRHYLIFMLNAVMLNVILLNVIMLNVVMPNVVMLNVVILNVVMMNVVAPSKKVGFKDLVEALPANIQL